MRVLFVASVVLSSAVAFAPKTSRVRSSAASTSMVAEGFAATIKPPAPALTQDDARFAEWARSEGVQTAALELSDVGGYRGVKATASIDAQAPLLTVPHKLVLETNTLDRTPPRDMADGWVDPTVFSGSPWYVRLALLLCRQAELGASSPLAPWIKVLPASFDELPLGWTTTQLDQLQYPPLVGAVEAQRSEYAAAYAKLKGSASACAGAGGYVSEERFVWALNVVRSRAFSGVYEGNSYQDRVMQGGFALALAAGGAATGMIAPEQALNGALVVGMSTVLTNIFLTKSESLKRYVLCPFVDMLNHKSSIQSDVSYEYFGNAFTALAETSFGPREEVCLSYGQRSNDQLLQFYGFVENENPYEQYGIEELLERVDAAMPDGIPDGRLKQLQMAGLVDSIRNGTATANGFVDETVRAVRVVAATDAELSSMGPGRVSESNDLDLSKRTNRILAAVCEEELGSLPTTLDEDLKQLKAMKSAGSFGIERSTLEFRVNKKRVLRRCAENLKAIS